MKRLQLLFSIVLVLVLAACSSKDSDTAAEETGGTPKEVTIGYQVIPNAELLAKELGLVEKKFPDTKINWVQFDSGRDVNTAMASGDVDLGLAGSVPVVTGIATKLPYKVYYIHDVIGESESLVVKKSLNMKSVADLKGKRLAVPFGSTAHFSLLKALELKGVDPSDVYILDMQPQDILAAWQRGDVDGAFVWQPTLGKLKEDGDILTTAQQLAEDGVMTADIGIVRQEFSEKYPSFLAAYKTVLDGAVQTYKEDPEQVATTLSGVLGVTKEEVAPQIEGLIWVDSKDLASSTYFGTEKQKGQFGEVLHMTGDFLVEQKIISSNPALNVYEDAIQY